VTTHHRPIDRIELLEWLRPYCEPDRAAANYHKKSKASPGWVQGCTDVDRAIAAYADGTLTDEVFESVTLEGVPYTITRATRLGLVPHRAGMVTVFCVDLDDHDGDGGNIALFDPVCRFFGAQPVVFTSRRGKGLHCFFRLEEPVPVDRFVKWLRAWGFNRTGQPEMFPKTHKLTQVFLPNEPNDAGGDTYRSGDFDSCVVRALPPAPSAPVTNTTLGFLRGEARPSGRNDALNKAAFELGTKGFDRAEASRLCEQAARWCGLEPDETRTTFRSGYEAGRTGGSSASNPKTTAPIRTLDGIGNGERFAERYGTDARYCFQSEQWLVWCGTCWTADSAARLQAWAKDTARSIEDEREQHADASEHHKAARAFESHLRRTASTRGIAEILDLARSEPGIGIGFDELDKDPMLFNCANGTVDLRTGLLRPHDRADAITKVSPARFDPDARCPRWLAFLEQVLDPDLIDYIQRAVGYALTGRTDEQCLFFLLGEGCNGKSVFMSTLLHLFGDYGQKAPTDLIMKTERSSPGSASPDAARLRGVRLVVTSELDAGQRLGESKIKDLTGGDRIVARPLYKPPQEFEPTHTIFVYGNHKPGVTGTDHGIWRRIRIIPFDVTIPEHDRDNRLAETLKDEIDGILAWAVRGCLAWQRDGLNPPETVSRSVGELRRECDPIGRFIESCFERGDGLITPKSDTYAAYGRWCAEEDEEPVTKEKLGREFKARGVRESRSSTDRWWVDLELRPTWSGGHD
tara:strand:+ start:1713 stop:3953 length:2241 start_codon:yes stop_codon:yes gene_type:complete